MSSAEEQNKVRFDLAPAVAWQLSGLISFEGCKMYLRSTTVPVKKGNVFLFSKVRLVYDLPRFLNPNAYYFYTFSTFVPASSASNFFYVFPVFLSS